MTDSITSVATESNHLFPVFLKLGQLRVLIVGGGATGLEKLNALVANSPKTKIKIVSNTIREEITTLASTLETIELHEREFVDEDLDNIDIVIVAVNDKGTSAAIRHSAKDKGILVNVADTPELCDFYLGSVVKKGNLKIAISTNGKSPTIAKRLKEIFADSLPEETDKLLDNMQTIRGKLNGNLSAKIIKLNKITESLVADTRGGSFGERQWKRIASYSLFAFFFMFHGHLVLSYIPISALADDFKKIVLSVDSNFYWMIGAGFLAQLVDGLLGMGYGVTCTTVLLSLGISLPAISGSIHTAEMFSSGVSGYSHYRFGNVNKKLFQKLLIPGVVGAVLGAYLLSKFGNEYAKYIRPLLALYTIFLGTKILRAAFQKNRVAKKVRRVGWLAGAGGFLDSFGGGGWGPLVTSTLISKGRSPQYVIGSVSITEFFITLASALTFFSMLGINHWPIILGLIVGGTIAAPFAARLAGKLPVKIMFIGVGGLVIIWSIIVLSRFLLG